MAPSSSDATSLLTCWYDRLAAYCPRGDNINRVDATALIFSAAALVAFMSAGDSEDATATSLRARGGCPSALVPTFPCAAHLAPIWPFRADVLPHALWRCAQLSGAAALLARRLRRKLDRAASALTLAPSAAVWRRTGVAMVPFACGAPRDNRLC
eukprot:scaffold113434_cov60-Phaeocystis_antarctica.AAC.7